MSAVGLLPVGLEIPRAGRGQGRHLAGVGAGTLGPCECEQMTAHVSDLMWRGSWHGAPSWPGVHDPELGL